MSFIQYLKDTQGELRHVAWPSRLQTIVYTILVALISIGVALYLGLFDYLFTSTLARFLGVAPTQSPITVSEQSVATSSENAGQATTPVFGVDPASTTQ